MGKYTVEDYLNEMDLAEAKEEEEDTEDVEEGLDAELTEGLKILEQNLTILFEEAEKKGKVKEVWGKVVGKVKGAGSAVAGSAKKVGGAVSGAGKKAAGAVSGAGKKVGEKAKAAGAAVKAHPVKAGLAGAGLAAALGGGALAYRKYFGKAAKACKDKKGAEKAACMKKFRAGATEAAIMALQDNASHCDNSKAPEKCYARVNEAIEQLRTNLDVLREG